MRLFGAFTYGMPLMMPQGVISSKILRIYFTSAPLLKFRQYFPLSN